MLETEPTETEILQAQLEIAEAKIISLTAEKAGLEKRITELESLLANPTAQAVLTKAAMAIGEQLDLAKTASISIPEDLSVSEKQAIIALRESQQAALTAKQDEYKKYIRGEL